MVNSIWKRVSLGAAWHAAILLWLSSTLTAAYNLSLTSNLRSKVNAFQNTDLGESNSGRPMQLALLPMGMPLPAGGVAISFVQPMQIGEERDKNGREQDDSHAALYPSTEGDQQEGHQAESQSTENEQYYYVQNDPSETTNDNTTLSEDGSVSKQQWKSIPTKVQTFIQNHSRRDLSQQQQDTSNDGDATASTITMTTGVMLSAIIAGMGFLTARTVRRKQSSRQHRRKPSEQEYAFDPANIPPSSGYIYNTFDDMEERPKYLVPWKGSDLDKFDV
jgi:hypothetical protein